MKNSQKGFAISWVIAIVAVLVIGGGVYFYQKQKNKIPVLPFDGREGNSLSVEERRQYYDALSKLDSNTLFTLWKKFEEQKRKQKELLIEGCKEMAEDSLRITKEWESTDATLDWEWNEN